MVIGLTGSSGSGKSTVARVFAGSGFTHIDLDALSHMVTSGNSACLNELAAFFGKEVLAPEGGLDRRKLGEIVFSSKAALAELNNITHKYILEEMHNAMDAAEGDILLDAPLLFEAGIDRLCDLCIGVIADRKAQISRIAARDGLSREAAEARLNNQHTNDFFIRSCHICIENNGTEAQLEKKASELIRSLRKERNDG